MDPSAARRARAMSGAHIGNRLPSESRFPTEASYADDEGDSAPRQDGQQVTGDDAGAVARRVEDGEHQLVEMPDGKQVAHSGWSRPIANVSEGPGKEEEGKDQEVDDGGRRILVRDKA